MAKINGVVIPTQLTLAVLNQLRHYVTNHSEESTAWLDEDAYICNEVSRIFDLRSDYRWRFDWFRDFLDDLRIPQINAFAEVPIWWPESGDNGLAFDSATRNARRLQFIDMLIHEVMQGEING